MRALILLLLAPMAYAGNDDLEALALADAAPSQAQRTSDWQVYAESALGNARSRDGMTPTSSQRLSLDLRVDKTLTPGWRAVVADRLDATWAGDLASEGHVNTLKEAYLSWQVQPTLALDAGRINPRSGVASGYNPTDFFRDGTVRSVVSSAPSSLRENRLGTGMLRMQQLWDGGAVTAIYAPKLGDAPSASPFAVDFGASNPRARWQLSASQQLSDNINPQLLLYGEQGKALQFGLNLSLLASEALVTYIEYSGGRMPAASSSLFPASADDSKYRSRLASGLSYTFPSKLTLTLEYQYDGSALDASAWQALGNGPAQRYGQYRSQIQRHQDLPTREAAFALASWTDMGISHLDLTAFARRDLVDRSSMGWLEARYHFEQMDVAVQWQTYIGTARSNYGAQPQAQAWTALVKYFF